MAEKKKDTKAKAPEHNENGVELSVHGTDPAIEKAAKDAEVAAAIAKQEKEADDRRAKMRAAEIEANKAAEKTRANDAKEEAAREEAMMKKAKELAAQQEKETGKRIYISRRPGLKLIIRCKDRVWDENLKKVKTVQEIAIQFEAGRFVTSDKEEIAFLDEYIKKNPNDVTVLADHILIMQKAIDKYRNEELAKAGLPLSSGTQGLSSGA